VDTHLRITTPLTGPLTATAHLTAHLTAPRRIAGLATLLCTLASASASAQSGSFACTAARLYQDTIDLDHRGWGVDARGNWDGGATLRDVLAGGIRVWDAGTIPDGQTSISLYLNAAVGPGQDCQYPSETVAGVGIDRFGHALAWLGDLDADGRDDFVVGAPRGGAGTERGRIYLFLSSDFAPGSLPAGAEGASLIIEGVVDGGRFGYSAASAGHFIPEGSTPYLDLIVGAPGGHEDPLLAQPGTAFVFSGRDLLRTRSTLGKSALTYTTDTSYAHGVSSSGANALDRYGHAVALAGDVNQDGAHDVVIGAPQWHFSAGLQTTGRGYGRVILGGATHTVYTLRGEQDGSQFGNCVGGDADIDGGGDEVLVGAPLYDDVAASPTYHDVGKVYLWSHAQPLTYVRVHTGRALEYTPGTWFGEQLGWGLTGIGDSNADARDEYTLGSYAYSPAEQPGGCSAAPAPCSGVSTTGGGELAGRSVIADGATGKPLFVIVGEDARDACGAWASPIGDVNGDRKADVVVSAFRWAPTLTQPPVPNDQRELGRVYLHLMK
jgi:hypothetical protein